MIKKKKKERSETIESIQLISSVVVYRLGATDTL